MKNVGDYLARLMSDQTGDPSCKRYMCVLFAMVSVLLAFGGYEMALVSVFVAAAVGENITSIFEVRTSIPIDPSVKQK